MPKFEDRFVRSCEVKHFSMKPGSVRVGDILTTTTTTNTGRFVQVCSVVTSTMWAPSLGKWCLGTMENASSIRGYYKFAPDERLDVTRIYPRVLVRM